MNDYDHNHANPTPENNRFITCLYCDKKIPATFNRCPHCGRKMELRRSGYEWIAWCVFAVVSIWALSALFHTLKNVLKGEQNTTHTIKQEIILVHHKVVDDSDLAPKNGRRIEIHCNNPNLTREEAEQLINHYRSRAGYEGQIGIWKPDKDNNYFPWAVMNAGEYTEFNDYFFK